MSYFQARSMLFESRGQSHPKSSAARKSGEGEGGAAPSHPRCYVPVLFKSVLFSTGARWNTEFKRK